MFVIVRLLRSKLVLWKFMKDKIFIVMCFFIFFIVINFDVNMLFIGEEKYW